MPEHACCSCVLLEQEHRKSACVKFSVRLRYEWGKERMVLPALNLANSFFTRV
jgi:hypothetical protein